LTAACMSQLQPIRDCLHRKPQKSCDITVTASTTHAKTSLSAVTKLYAVTTSHLKAAVHRSQSHSTGQSCTLH
jgi:hypothetical protein